jgi:hypothetical protein
MELPGGDILRVRDLVKQLERRSDLIERGAAHLEGVTGIRLH